VYRQLERILREQILAGELHAGESLPLQGRESATALWSVTSCLTTMTRDPPICAAIGGCRTYL
jgi:hypothetical protein